MTRHWYVPGGALVPSRLQPAPTAFRVEPVRGGPYAVGVAKEVPGPWIRRPASIVTVTLATLLTPLVTPIALLIAAAGDAIKRTRGMRRTRTVALITSLILVDFAGFLLVSFTWLISPLGWSVERPASQARYSRIMNWWTGSLIRQFSRFVPLPIDRSELDPEVLKGNAIVIGRHRSLIDALMPAIVFGGEDLRVLYVLKDDLQWETNIDIVGHRMGHVFVDRNPKNLDRELEPIRKLATKIDDESVGVIFPEGTFFNEKRKARAVASLQRRNAAHAAAAESMRCLLPPRPAGTLALLEGAPDADVVLLGHVGFEPFGSIRQILGNIGGEHGIRLKAWRFACETVPVDPAEQVDWLFERWTDMDSWIAEQHELAERSTTFSRPDQ